MGQNISPLLHIEKAPVWCSGLCHTRASALEVPTAPILLAFCHDCGHLFNQKYETVQYGRDYDSSLDFSGVFQNYAENLGRYARAAILIAWKDHRGDRLRPRRFPKDALRERGKARYRVRSQLSV